MTFMEKFPGFDIIDNMDGEEKRQAVTTLSIHPDETHLAYTSLGSYQSTQKIIFADFHGNKIRNIPSID
jgi:hypothetical protein